MDPETLKIITEAITKLGEQGTTAFIGYLAIVYGASLLKAMMGWGVAAFAIVSIYKVVDRGISKAK